MATLEKLREGKNFIVYKSGDQKLIKLINVRLSYPFLGEKRVDEGDDGTTKASWQGVVMLPKETHVAAKDAFKQLMDELQEANKVKVPAEYRCLKDGNDKDDENMHGHYLIGFSDAGKRRPGVRDAGANIMTDAAEIDDTFFGGVWVDIILRPWYFNGKAKNKAKTYPKRICCGFTGVMFNHKDSPLGGGRIDDSDAWGAPSGASTADDDDDI